MRSIYLSCAMLGGIVVLGCGRPVETAVIIAAEQSPAKHGEFAAENVVVNKSNREFRLVVPKTVDLSKPAPLVIAFHGMLIDSKDLMPAYTKLNETASKHGFIIAYPQAIGKSWGISPEKVTADLAFFDAMLSQISKKYKVDPNQIFVLGMSNGGYFAHLVAKERSTKIAAIASHSGVLGLQTLGGVKADRKFPVLMIHGEKDPIIPIAFVRENREKYKKEGHVVELIELPGEGHMWGTKAQVNESIWQFFSQHPLKKK